MGRRVKNLLPDYTVNVDNISQAVAELWRELEKKEGFNEIHGFLWEHMSRMYARREDMVYHVSYWDGERHSSGESVRAFNVAHALDIMYAKKGVTENRLIYIHCKDSQFEEN